MTEEKYPQVSIIVLNLNGKHIIHHCLDSLSKVGYPKDKMEKKRIFRLDRWFGFTAKWIVFAGQIIITLYISFNKMTNEI